LPRRLIGPRPRLTSGIVAGEATSPEVALSQRSTLGGSMSEMGQSRPIHQGRANCHVRNYSKSGLTGTLAQKEVRQLRNVCRNVPRLVLG
jgi:hypothetical protein